MALSIVLGSSGSGKSTYVYKKILEEAKANKDKNFLVIVPEQYTMATQRLLVQMHESNCIMNIDVLSFNRLAYRIFEELGVAVLDILDDVGKSLVLRKLVNEKLDELVALKKNITRISYITQVKSLISEMTQYNITPDVLREMIAYGPMSESFRLKASDLLVMYEAFLDFTNGKYITTEAILSKLNEVLADSEIVANSTVVLDGFTGFTPIQYELVENMLGLCEEVLVTVTGDINESYMQKRGDEELFSMSAEFVATMVARAKYRKVEINEPILISNDKGRFSNNEVLAHLEKNMFRANSRGYEGKIKASEVIELETFKNVRDELEHAAIEIRRMVKENNYRYEDFALVCPNLENYRYHVDDIWKRYEIPYFVDAKTEILFHPFVEMISSFFEIMDSNFSKDSVFRFLRTGYTDICEEDIDFLENYILSTGMRGKNKYFHPFAVRSNTYREDADILRVNQIREAFIKPFIQFDKAIDNTASVRDIAVALYNFIVYFGCDKKISAREEWHEANRNLVKAKEYSQIYKTVMKLLEQMVVILGNERMDLEEFSDILEAGLASSSIGIVPPANDSVIIGDMERTRIDGIKVLFCVGASDDAIPKKIENGGILSQIEREQLLEKFEMAPSDRQKAFRQRFYLYMMLTKPEHKLIITAPRVNGDGKATNKSYLFETISQMFDIKSHDYEDFGLEERLSSVFGAQKLLIELLQKATVSSVENLTAEEFETLQLLFAWSKGREDISLERLFDAAFFSHTKEVVSRDVMLAVNEAFNEDETVSGSVSKFEDYAECGFKFFLKYILKLNDRESAKLSAIDLGNFNHEALERYSRLLKEDNKRWADTSADERGVYIDTAIKQTYEAMKKVATLEDPTQNYIVETMKSTLRHTVEIITEQVKRGTFEPELFEEQINSQISSMTTNEVVASLRGKVDRVDMTESDVDRAVRIIDYKSSAHKLSLDECYYGLSLQLPIYMGVVLRKLQKKYQGVNIHPSALLYYKTDNPFVDRASKESLKESILAASKMDGLVCDNEDDIFANDKTINMEDNKRSSIIPVAYSSKGVDSRLSHTINKEGMDIMVAYSSYKASVIAQNILDGEFDCHPAKLGKGENCSFCDYKAICHFDEKVDGYEINELEVLNAKAIEKMTEELKHGAD